MGLARMPGNFASGGAGIDTNLKAILAQLRAPKLLQLASGSGITAAVKATATLSDGTNNTLRLDGRLGGEHGNLLWRETKRRTLEAGGKKVFDLTIHAAKQGVAGTTFTAATTDVCTATAHGLLTGDGPLRLSNSGGALPAGLSAATLYWAVKTGADTFKLAATKANAVADTPVVVDVTGTGTGTHTFHRMKTEQFVSLSMLDADDSYVEKVVNSGEAGRAASEWVQAVDLDSAAAEDRPTDTTVPVVLASGANEVALTGVVRGDHVAAVLNTTDGAVVAATDIVVTDKDKVVSVAGVAASKTLLLQVLPAP